MRWYEWITTSAKVGSGISTESEQPLIRLEMVKLWWFLASWCSHQGAYGQPCSLRGCLGQSIAPHSQARWPPKHQGTSWANGDWRCLECGDMWRGTELGMEWWECSYYFIFHICFICFSYTPNMHKPPALIIFDPHPLGRGIIGASTRLALSPGHAPLKRALKWKVSGLVISHPSHKVKILTLLLHSN